MSSSPLSLPPASQALFADFSGIQTAAKMSDFFPSNNHCSAFGSTASRTAALPVLTIARQDGMRLSVVSCGTPGLDESCVLDEGESARIETLSPASAAVENHEQGRLSGFTDPVETRDKDGGNRLGAGITVGSEVDITTLAIHRAGTDIDMPTPAVRSLRNLLQVRDHPEADSNGGPTTIPAPNISPRAPLELSLAEALLVTPPHASSTQPRIPVMTSTLPNGSWKPEPSPFVAPNITNDSAPAPSLTNAWGVVLKRGHKRVSNAIASLRNLQHRTREISAIAHGVNERHWSSPRGGVDDDDNDHGKRPSVLAKGAAWVNGLFSREMNVFRHY